jgi:hypothetical protein
MLLGGSAFFKPFFSPNNLHTLYAINSVTLLGMLSTASHDSIQNTSWEMTEGTQLRFLVHRLKSQHNTDLLIRKAHELFQHNNGAGNQYDLRCLVQLPVRNHFQL